MNYKDFQTKSDDYYRIDQAIGYITHHFLEHPNLDQLASQVHMSKYYFQRLFRRWAGISPSQFIQYLTLEYTKKRLKESRSVLEAALSAGLSGPGRLHDLFVTFEAITPGDYKKSGHGIQISYGFHPTPFGKCLIAGSQRGICYIAFEEDERNGLLNLRTLWPKSNLTQDSDLTKSFVKSIFSDFKANQKQPFNLILKGTNFQI